MANSLSIDNCLIQVRSCLQEEGIKLWLEPYYVQGIGPVDAELEVFQHVVKSDIFHTTSFFPQYTCLSLSIEIGHETITDGECSL